MPRGRYALRQRQRLHNRLQHEIPGALCCTFTVYRHANLNIVVVVVVIVPPSSIRLLFPVFFSLSLSIFQETDTKLYFYKYTLDIVEWNETRDAHDLRSPYHHKAIIIVIKGSPRPFADLFSLLIKCCESIWFEYTRFSLSAKRDRSILSVGYFFKEKEIYWRKLSEFSESWECFKKFKHFRKRKVIFEENWVFRKKVEYFWRW